MIDAAQVIAADQDGGGAQIGYDLPMRFLQTRRTLRIRHDEAGAPLPAAATQACAFYFDIVRLSLAGPAKPAHQQVSLRSFHNAGRVGMPRLHGKQILRFMHRLFRERRRLFLGEVFFRA